MGELPYTVAYHDACHLVHGQKIKQQPRQLLKAIPGITMVDLKEADWCCGSAGIYNLTNQEMATQLLERKMKNIAATGANIIATGNPGCMMQIALGARERNMNLKVVHPVQLLDEAYQVGRLYNASTKNIAENTRRQLAVFAGIGISVMIGFMLARRHRNRL
jgi:glycolate oxidase iron-sulfur subunit